MDSEQENQRLRARVEKLEVGVRDALRLCEEDSAPAALQGAYSDLRRALDGGAHDKGTAEEPEHAGLGAGTPATAEEAEGASRAGDGPRAIRTRHEWGIAANRNAEVQISGPNHDVHFRIQANGHWHNVAAADLGSDIIGLEILRLAARVKEQQYLLQLGDVRPETRDALNALAGVVGVEVTPYTTAAQVAEAATARVKELEGAIEEREDFLEGVERHRDELQGALDAAHDTATDLREALHRIKDLEAEATELGEAAASAHLREVKAASEAKGLRVRVRELDGLLAAVRQNRDEMFRRCFRAEVDLKDLREETPQAEDQRPASGIRPRSVLDDWVEGRERSMRARIDDLTRYVQALEDGLWPKVNPGHDGTDRDRIDELEEEVRRLRDAINEALPSVVSFKAIGILLAAIRGKA